MPGKCLITKIKEDLHSVYGDIAEYLVMKRMDDLGLRNKKTVTFDEVEKVIGLLRKNTFPLTIGSERGLEKAHLYMRWLNEERAVQI